MLMFAIRFNRKDRQWHFVKTAKIKTKQDKFKKYTLVVRRVISSKGHVAEIEVDIKSQKLTELLLKIFEGVEGLKLTSSPPTVGPKRARYSFDSPSQLYLQG
jgi:predicted transglutaminase-like protease